MTVTCLCVDIESWMWCFAFYVEFVLCRFANNGDTVWKTWWRKFWNLCFHFYISCIEYSELEINYAGGRLIVCLSLRTCGWLQWHLDVPEYYCNRIFPAPHCAMELLPCQKHFCKRQFFPTANHFWHTLHTECVRSVHNAQHCYTVWSLRTL